MKTAVEWLLEQLDVDTVLTRRQLSDVINQAKAMEREQKILLIEELKDYTKESQCILGNDEREASEFVDIFYNKTFKQQEQ